MSPLLDPLFRVSDACGGEVEARDLRPPTGGDQQVRTANRVAPPICRQYDLDPDACPPDPLDDGGLHNVDALG